MIKKIFFYICINVNSIFKNNKRLWLNLHYLYWLLVWAHVMVP